MANKNSGGSLMEVLGIGLAVFGCAALIAEYLHDRKVEKEDQKYQELCQRHGWTQADQDKYGDCNQHNLISRCKNVNNISWEEARKKVMGLEPLKETKPNYSWMADSKRPDYKAIYVPGDRPWKASRKIYVPIDESK